MGRWPLVLSLVFVLSLFVDRSRAAQESPTLSAMQDEMKRSMAELRMKGEARPYYIAYEVLDRTMSDVSGRLGAIVENPPRRTRTLRVEVRVGDYAFDSSRFVVQGFGGGAVCRAKRSSRRSTTTTTRCGGRSG